MNHAGKIVAKSNFVTLGLKISIWCMAIGLGWMECIFAVPVRIAAFNLYQGVEDTGSAEYEATRAILQRVNTVHKRPRGTRAIPETTKDGTAWLGRL